MTDPCNHTIHVNYDLHTQQFKYTDENGGPANPKYVKSCHTIQWHLDTPAGYTVSVEFGKDQKPSPFDTGEFKVSADTPKTIGPDHFQGDSRCYTVYIRKDNADVNHDDPKIIFDDGHRMEGGPYRLGIPDPVTIATATQAAKAAWQDIFKDLQSAKAKAASGIVFYPYGINDIEATINAGPVSVTIKVSGPSSKT